MKLTDTYDTIDLSSAGLISGDTIQVSKLGTYDDVDIPYYKPPSSESKPLTNREIFELNEDPRWNKIPYQDLYSLVRKVESMHGVGKKSKKYL